MDILDVEKLMPRNIKAEQNVLGSMILRSDLVSTVSELLPTIEYFFVPSHQQIYKAILEINRKNEIVEITSLYTELENKGIIDDIGGFSYLSDLTDIISRSNIETYCNHLIDSFQRRELIAISHEIIKEAYNTSNEFAVTLDTAEKKILSVSEKRNIKGLVHIKEVVKERFKRFDKLFEDGYKPDTTIMKTHFDDLDELLQIKNNNLIILAGRPGSGKTASVLNIMTNVALKSNLPVLMFSIEMSKEQVTDRMLVAEAELPKAYLDSGNFMQHEYDLLVEAYQRIYNSKIYVDDYEEANIQNMISKARKLKKEHGRLGLIVVDYIQLMEGDGKEQNRVQEVSKVSRGLKKMARALDCPVIALSQLSRDVEKRQDKRPQLSDLRDSGSLEQDADSVLFIYRDEYYNKDTNDKGIAEINIAKQREGASNRVVKLYFKPEITRFYSLESVK